MPAYNLGDGTICLGWLAEDQERFTFLLEPFVLEYSILIEYGKPEISLTGILVNSLADVLLH